MTGFPGPLDSEEVRNIALDAMGEKASFLYRTGTIANGPQPAVGQPYQFQSGVNQIEGSSIAAPIPGFYDLDPGSYWLSAVIRSGNYNNGNGLCVWQWYDYYDDVYFGQQAIHYANANTGVYTHQPVTTGFRVHPAGAFNPFTRVGITVVGLTNGLTFDVSELRSSISIMRVA